MTHVLIPRTPTLALLRPFFECPTSELDQAWAAMVRIAEVQHARAGSQCLAQPVLYVSPGQLANHSNPEGPESEKAGRYLPARVTPAGKFTQPLYAGVAPAAVAPQDVVAWMHPETRNVISAAHKHDMSTEYGAETRRKAESYSVALVRAGEPAAAAPALEAPAAPAGNEEVAFTKWFQCQQGTPYQGMWEFARAAWMARAAAPALDAPAAPATSAQVQALHRARRALHAIGKTYDDSELRTRALEADEEIDRMLAAAPQTPAREAPVAPAGALKREAELLATILRSLAPEGYVPEGVDIYAPDFAPSDGDVFVRRAAQVLEALAAAPQAPAAPADAQAFVEWWDRERGTARNRLPGDDWMDLSNEDREQYEAAFNAGMRAAKAAPAAPAVDADPLGLRDVGEAFMQAIERNSDALKAVGWLGPMDCPSEIVADLLNLLEEANTTSALGEWVATLEVDSGGGLDYETVPPCTLPPGCYPLYRAAQAAAKGEHAA